MPILQLPEAIKRLSERHLSWPRARVLGSSSTPGGRRRISLEDQFLLARQLHVLHKAGVPLLASLRALESQVPPGRLKQMLQGIAQDLLNGYTLSQAFGRYADVFTPVFIGMLRIGEAGGLLEEMLARLTKLCEWEMELRSKIKQALMYPAIVLATLTVAILLILTFVLPQFVRLFRSWDLTLPLQTRVVLAASWVVTHYGWLLALGALAIGVALWSYIHTDHGRLWWHKTLLRLPIIGPLFVQLAMSRFTRTMAALNASGVPILETLALAGESVNNRYIQSGLEKVYERVKGGEGLSKALATDGLFSPVVLQMVATGEETGHMDELLHSVSDYYDQQASYLLRKLITYIEPVLLIVVGAGVLLLAMAVLVPMWDMYKVLKVGR